MAASKKPVSVDDYISGFPPDVQTLLQDVRNTIRKAAPEAVEKMSYGVVGYMQWGMLIFFGAFKNHCSLFAISKPLIKKYEKELNKLEIANTTIHFTPSNPFPKKLLTKLVKERLEQNRLVFEMKKQSKASKAVSKKAATKKPKSNTNASKHRVVNK